MKKIKNKKKKDSFFSRFIQGRWISTTFLSRNAILLLSFLFFLMIYISNKYACQTKMEKILVLQQELEKVKTESVRERSIYMSNTRESAMKAMIDTMSLGLQIQEKPPYNIKYSK